MHMVSREYFLPDLLCRCPRWLDQANMCSASRGRSGWKASWCCGHVLKPAWTFGCLCDVEAWLGGFWALLSSHVKWVQLCGSLSILWHCQLTQWLYLATDKRDPSRAFRKPALAKGIVVEKGTRSAPREVLLSRLCSPPPHCLLLHRN